MKHILLNYINKKGNVSFVEIEELFEKHSYNYKGDYILKLNGYDNIVMWDGWNNEAIGLIKTLMQKRVIELNSCNVMIYVIDGKSLSYPIAQKLKSYKQEHWIPVVLDKHIA